MGNATTARENEIISALRSHANSIAERAHVPFSGDPSGVALLLSDGRIVPGVRVESASFSLVIPALLNGISTAIALERSDVVAGAMNRPLKSWDRSYLHGHFDEDLSFPGDDVFVSTKNLARKNGEFPDVAHPLPPFIASDLPKSDEDGVHQARQVAKRAFVPQSEFEVGCLALLDNTRLVPGVNVEHPNWSSIICAERNVLGTCVSYGLSTPSALFLSCPDDPHGSPCGACRQLLAEFMPDVKLCMDRGDAPPQIVTPSALLPGSFSGESIRSKL